MYDTKELIFKLPIYRDHIAFIQTSDNDYLKQEWDIDLSEDIYGHVFDSIPIELEEVEYTADVTVMILNPNYPYRSINAGVIAHEALHVVHSIMKKTGCLLDLENPEHETYLLESIVNSALLFFDWDKEGIAVDDISKNALKRKTPTSTHR